MFIRSTSRSALLGFLASTAGAFPAFAQTVPCDAGGANVGYDLQQINQNPLKQVLSITLSRVGRPGDAGANGGLFGSGRTGDQGGQGPSIYVLNCSPIVAGDGIFIRSSGATGGRGGESGVFETSPGNGGAGGDGGRIRIDTSTTSSISTPFPGYSYAPGIVAISSGGAGNQGGDGSDFGDNGRGGIGGNGGEIMLNLAGGINTSGNNSPAVYGLSLGGNAGLGGAGGYLFGKPGDGGPGGNAGNDITANILADADIQTSGKDSAAVQLESIGGQGGTGGGASATFEALGASGGIGGSGGDIILVNAGYIYTGADNAKAIVMQSIGGGGGSGGDAFDIGAIGGVAVGGSGGGGGHGGSLTLDQSYIIATSGYGSHGVFANSIGGGGGDGGRADGVSIGYGVAIQVSVGGSGGSGGNGGPVTIYQRNRSKIGTGYLAGPQTIAGVGQFAGDHANGIFAQSVGGGGGSGGRALAVAASGSADTPSVSVAVGIGGAGGSGGSGDRVNVITDYTTSVTTRGRMADAIFAQSIGGGGGSGGSVVTVAAAVAEMSGAISVAIGGTGGSGGSGSTATITSNGTVTTLSNMSNGLVARSVGGGGGSGGNAVDIAASLGKYSGSIGVGIGGSGGSGGDAGDTVVVNNNTVATAGHRSHGIVSQSVGGGGGSGGNVHTYGIAVSAGGGSSGIAASASVGVGGSGGSGGAGGTASVTQAGSVSTTGDMANGVFIQSIGGGGGDAGNVFAVSVAASIDKPSAGGSAQGGRNISAAVAVGGSGGTGGAGGYAGFTGRGLSTITTTGVRSSAVVVQSIGGGGGNGGHAYSFDVSSSVPVDPSRFAATAETWLGYYNTVTGTPGPDGPQPKDGTKNGLGASVTVGGRGGSGNIGGKVVVSLFPATVISTAESQSHGIFAQSIGGGGGSGGYAFSDGYAGASSFGLTMGIGGNGGTGGHGGNIVMSKEIEEGSPTANGRITTAGEAALGIFAQSVGGGGGEAGHATSKLSGTSGLSKPSAAISLGGQGGAAGNGGDVNIDLDQDFRTAGSHSTGVLAQSVGGGGGVGAASQTGAGLLQFALGGSGGAAGDGGNVILSMTGSIVTQGNIAHGLVAQSVGGGGGIGGNAAGPGSVSASLQVKIGGGGGGGGAGGAVTVAPVGSITTTGNASFGILAQSVGGGGGVVAASTLTIVAGDIPIIGNLSGSAGKGGDVTVNSYGTRLDIATSGAAAHGIFAQSVGGGGGALVMSNRVIFGLDPLSRAYGDAGGNVNVGVIGNISTRGDNAYGIFAQSSTGGLTIVSASGVSSAGTPLSSYGPGLVTVNQRGVINTEGSGAHGIVAAAANLSGPAVAVTVAGQVSVSGSSSWGIKTNNGETAAFSPNPSPVLSTTIDIAAAASVNAKGNLAPLSDGGGIWINDYLGSSRLNVAGVIDAGTGTAVKSAGPLALNVLPGAGVTGNIIGNSANLNFSGNTSNAITIVNSGRISGSVTGGATYTLGGQHRLGIDPLGNAGGTETIAVQFFNWSGGTIQPYLKSLPYAAAPMPPIDLVSGIDQFGYLSGAIRPDSLSTRFDLQYTAFGARLTGVSVDFTRAGLTGNDALLASIATNLLGPWTRVIATTGYDSLNDVLLRAANSNSKAELSKIFEDFDAATHYSTGGFLVLSNSDDQSALQSCGMASGSFAAIRETNCNWARVSQSDHELRNGDQRLGATTLSFGRQTEVRPGLFLGFSAGYADTDYRGKTSSADGYRLFVGGIAKRVRGPLLLSGSAVIGYGASDGRRTVGATGATATSRHETLALASRLRSVYLMEVGALNVMPMAELDVSLIRDAGYRETGAGAFNLRQRSKLHFVADVRPALRLGTDVNIGRVTIRGYVEGGARVALNDLSFNVDLPDGPQAHSSVALQMGRDRAVGTLAIGLTAMIGEQFEISGRYEASRGEETRSHTATLKAAYKF